MTENSPSQAVNWTEVGRVAHELQLCHGRSAQSFADKLAGKAESDGEIGGSAFWRAVSAALAPRDASAEQ